MDLSELWGFGVVAGVMVAFFLVGRLVSRGGGSRKNPIAEVQREMHERSEALFRASFPELQPHFHPARVHEFVKARVARKAFTGAGTWKNPPGFPAAESAEIEPDGPKDKVRLLDATGAVLASFVFEEHAEGGVLRVGGGKLTANVKDPVPRVRYWHPDREFKWTPQAWKFQTRVADRPVESSDSGTSFSSDTSSSSSSSIARGAAAGAAIVAAGGSFDGGGASQAWDDAGGDGASGDASESTATAY